MAAMTAIGPARGVTLQAARLPLRVRLGGIRRQPGPPHALDRAVFVLVRRVAADADGADGGAALVQDEHADRQRQEILGTRGAEGAVEDRASTLEREAGDDVAQEPVHGATLYMVTMRLRNP